MEKNQRQHILYRKGVYVLWTVLLSALLISGCSTLDTMLQRDGNAKSTLGNWIGTGSTAPAVQNPVPSGEGKIVMLYFADSTGRYLVKEERTIPNTLSLARETVNQWLKGPAAKGSGSLAATPPGTALLDIAIKDGSAIVDFSGEFSRSYSKVTPEVRLYALADTLTQFASVKEVQIQVEGKTLTTLGNVPATHLKFQAGLVKGVPVASSGTVVPGAGTGSTGNSSSTGSLSNTGSSGGSTSAGGSSGGNKMNLSPSSLNFFSAPVSST